MARTNAYADQAVPRSREPSLEKRARNAEARVSVVDHDAGWAAERSDLDAHFLRYAEIPQPSLGRPKSSTMDRQEIIRKRKAASRPTSPEIERGGSSSPMNMARKITQSQAWSSDASAQNETLGREIERPRSALHRGDFREERPLSESMDFDPESPKVQQTLSLATSPVAPWHSAFPLAAKQYSSTNAAIEDHRNVLAGPPMYRSRALSTVTPFIYKAPTSPLVHASRPDTPDQSSRPRSRSPDRSRRHTYSPHSYSALLRSADQEHYSTNIPTLRSERTYPQQAHQPARPYPLQASASLPQTPRLGYRRPSIFDTPLHHAPLVGSYEESILRGRMSTIPSKPLNFLAQIGVLGKGDCKSSLKCPPHVSIPFPAVFYSYGSNGKASPQTDQPSPYVGLIDLENNLSDGEATKRRRQQRLQAALSPTGSRAISQTRDEDTASDFQTQQRRRQKQKRRSDSPRAPPGGCYRIPQTGQLQIVIKNPNKTAVKLYLVPYDLSDMQPGTKTFIRQRSYSAGPLIDMPLSSRKNLGTDRPEAGINLSGDIEDKPVLRYLIHLNICCPAKGRFFLYKSVRVVFANRVPDGKESLRNEIQLPEPRFSAYHNVPTAAVKTHSRRSSAVQGMDEQQQQQHVPPQQSSDQHWSQLTLGNLARSLPAAPYYNGHPRSSTSPYPFSILPTLDSRPASRHVYENEQPMRIDPQHYSPYFMHDQRTLQDQARSGMAQHAARDPQMDDPFHFEHDQSRDVDMGMGVGRGESLLSQRLRDLAFRQNADKGDGANKAQNEGYSYR